MNPKYQYQMFQVPTTIGAKLGDSQQAAADYLQERINHFAKEGWEFQCMETMTIHEQGGCGCLFFLFGGRPEPKPVYVLVFRKPA